MKIRYERPEIRFGNYVVDKPCCAHMELCLMHSSGTSIRFDTRNANLMIVGERQASSMRHCPFCGEKIDVETEERK